MARSGHAKSIATLLYSGALAEAVAACEDSLHRHPNDDEVLALHGQALAQLRRRDEAMASIMKAIRLEPKRPEYTTLLGELYMNSGRYRDALVQYDKAIKAHSLYDPAWAGKASTYLRMSKPEKARKVIEQRVESGDISPSIAVLHARVLVKLGEADTAVDILQPYLDDTSLPIENQRSAWFSLGSAHEKTGRLPDAFEAYAHANGLIGQRWNRAMDAGIHELTATQCSRADLQACANSEVDGSRMVFIVGLPRCGSTLTEQILHSHNAAHGIGESELLPIVAARFHERGENGTLLPISMKNLDEESLAAAASEYIDKAALNAGDATRIIDKQLGNYLYLGFIEKALPGARIIHCRRNPMDQCLSAWSRQFPPGTNAWADELESAGELYCMYENLMEHWRTTLTAPMLELRYEDLVQDTEILSRRIIEFCDLEWDPACLKFWENKRTVLTMSSDQVRQPIYDTARNRHRAWGELLDPLAGALGGAVERYGS
ncbi:MAG: sulfotransferase [Planctomycetota bacterium]|nr:sulfotransferase [Planctomycetota bacterium]